MKVPTANIVVAFNRATMERLFSAGATATSLMSTLSNDGEDKAILFNSESNPNFISFEHDNGMSPGMKMKLVFIDPKGEFENRYLSDSMLDNMAGYGYAPEEKQPSILTSRKNKQMKEGLSEYPKEYIDDFRKQYTAVHGTKEIYVAYGTGDNLDLWSGPHRTVLQAADISVKGARKITLTLTPTIRPIIMGQRRGAYNEPVNLNLRGATMRYNGTSKPIKFNRLLDVEYHNPYILGTKEHLAHLRAWQAVRDEPKQPPYDPLEYLNHHVGKPGIQEFTEETTQLFDKLGYSDLASNIGDFDLHSMVVDTLRNYIQTATSNSNVIVLLPNINLICRKIIDELAKNARVASTQAGQVAEYKANPGAHAANQVEINFGNHKQAREVGKKAEFVKDFLSKVGIEVKSINPILKLANSVLAQAEKLKFMSVEKAKTANESFNKLYTDLAHFASLEKSSSKGIPDHMGVVQSVINGINELSKGEYNISLTQFNETDINVLNHWAKTGAKYFPLFGGYHKFNNKQEAIIIGDSALIKDYLYAEINLEEEEAETAALKDKASAAKATQIKSFASRLFEDVPPEPVVAPQNVVELLPLQDLTPIMLIEAEEAARITAQHRRLKESRMNKLASDEALRARILQIPLHPLDRQILTQTSYNKPLKVILYPDIPSNNLEGSFGNISDVPDEFGYSNFSEEEKGFIKQKEISIFRYNTTNPNVLDLNFKFGGVYFGQLEMGFQKMVNRRASNVATGVLPQGTGSFPITTPGDAAAFLRMNNYTNNTGSEDREKLLQELTRRMSPELAASVKSDPTLGANFIANKLDEAQENDLQGYIDIGQMLPGNPNQLMTEFAEDMYREALNLNITTLPSFHLSKAVLGFPCVLFAQDQTILQSQQPTRTPLNSFFSGLYKVMGYKHTINATTCKSEFKLTKNSVRYDIEEDKKVAIAARLAELGPQFTEADLLFAPIEDLDG